MCRTILAVVVLAGLGILQLHNAADHYVSAAQPQPIVKTRLVVSRFALAHGRHDSLRTAGLQIPGSNPGGQPVPGLANLLRVISVQANPQQIFLDLDESGARPRIPGTPDPVVAAASGLPSGMTPLLPIMPRWGRYGSFGLTGVHVTPSLEFQTSREGKGDRTY